MTQHDTPAPQQISQDDLKRLRAQNPRLNADFEGIQQASDQIAIHEKQRDLHAEQAKLWEGRRFERQDRFQESLAAAQERDRAGQSQQTKTQETVTPPPRPTDLKEKRAERAAAEQARQAAEKVKRDKAKAARQARTAKREPAAKP